MGKFILTSEYKPTGDQPEAIRELTEGLDRGDRAQVLLGVTGSGKTFTMANVIAQHNRPTLILSHNKTLAHQLYMEMKEFFPQNAVEYYVSYYDYYQPEAYLPSRDLYIEKELSINDEIDRLRLSAVSNLLSGRNDVVVISSVSCIYGMGSPVALQENVIEIHKGQKIDRNALLRKLVQSLYVRNDLDLQRGNFRVKGDTVDVAMAYSEVVLRITFWDDVIDAIEELDAVTYDRLSSFDEYKLYPANLFMTSQEQTNIAIHDIQDDLMKQVAFFEEMGEPEKAHRIKERVEFDMEMIRNSAIVQALRITAATSMDEKQAKDLTACSTFPGRLFDDYRRESRHRSTDRRHVWRRPQQEDQSRGVWLPSASSLRQPPTPLRGVPGSCPPSDLRQCDTCRLRVGRG